MALVVSGQVHHRGMKPTQVQELLQEHLPGLVISAPDFSVERSNCKVDFFCNTSSTLDFTVTVTANAVPAPVVVALLVRETDSLNAYWPRLYQNADREPRYVIACWKMSALAASFCPGRGNQYCHPVPPNFLILSASLF